MEFGLGGFLKSSFSVDIDLTSTLPVLNFNPEFIKVTNNLKYFVAWKTGLKSEIMLIDWTAKSINQFIDPKPDYSSGGFTTSYMYLEFSIDTQSLNDMYAVRLDANNNFYVIKF
jgi:hypothetical protein